MPIFSSAAKAISAVFCAFALLAIVQPAAAEPLPEVVVNKATLKSTTRVSRTVYRYTFELQVRNTGAVRVTDVTSTATSGAPGTTIETSSVAISGIDPGAIATATGTLILRHDRQFAFAFSTNVKMQFDGARVTTTPPGLLSGPPGAPALGQIAEVESTVVPDSAILDGLFLTRIIALIEEGSTVGEVNSALLATGARISGSSAGSPLLELEVPRQDDLDAVDQFAAEITDSAGFAFAFSAWESAPDLLPPTPDDPIVSPAFAGGRLIKAPNAWNAKEHLDINPAPSAERVNLLVQDYFAASSSSFLPPFSLVGPTDLRCNPRTLRCVGNHGIGVMSVVGAFFDENLPTGIHPSVLHHVNIIANANSRGSWWRNMKEMSGQIPTGDVSIVNSSLGFNDHDDRDVRGHSLLERALLAIQWKWLVESRQGDFLHVTTLGNDGRRSGLAGRRISAEVNSPFTIAASYGSPCDIRSGFDGSALSTDDISICNKALRLFGTSSSKLTNIIGVGSVENDGMTLSDFSTRLDDVRSMAVINAPGREVFMACALSDPNCLLPPNQINAGTSFSAPAVAGAAALLSSFKPTATVPELKSALLATTQPLSIPVLDVYRAMLDIDKLKPLDTSELLARRAILDAATTLHSISGANGKFDHHDLEAFVDAFDRPSSSRDFSRFDLNADGFTGGPFVDRFDLNNDGRLTTASINVGGRNVITYDENLVTDANILCFYALSPLYAGSLEFRNAIIAANANKCAPIGEVVIAKLLIELSGVPSGWGSSGTISFEEIAPSVPNIRFYDGSRRGNPGCSFGERGGPVHSSAARALLANFYIPNFVLNAPFILGDSRNRQGCSDFIAVEDGQAWATASVRSDGFSGFTSFSRERQTRYYSGLPDSGNAGRQIQFVTVPNEFAAAGFVGSATDFEVRLELNGGIFPGK